MDAIDLKILTPTEILLEETVEKVNVDAENGALGLLPNHIDFVTVLVPGILTYTAEEIDRFVAVDEGILVKAGSTVTISTRRGVKGRDLEHLSATVEEQYRTLDDREKQARSAVAKLEAGFARRIIEQGGQNYGTIIWRISLSSPRQPPHGDSRQGQTPCRSPTTAQQTPSRPTVAGVSRGNY
ncbi:F0F1 ATP synthase subunit epsilon [Baaleninema sp.]|uniref:F0F1 ATP synthase subunit epsilon n=1 Tax=Baaleninema sp. TaxID=3101197 RepID=UPI003D0812FC